MTIEDVALPALRYWGLLCAVSLPLALAVRRLGHPDSLPRLLAWYAIVPIFLGAAYLGPLPFGALLILVCLAASRELSPLALPASRRWVAFAFAGALSAPWILWAAFDGDFPTLLPALVALALLTARALLPAVQRGWPESATLGAVIGCGLCYWVLLQDLPLGFRYVLFCFSVVVAADVMAFVFGRLLRGYRPFRQLSPNKTAAGYAGACVGGALMGAVFSFALPEAGLATLMLLSLSLVAAGAVGDLYGSRVKRRHGIKDFGRLLGPMGGILDRLDSLAASGWVMYLYLH